MSPSSAPSPRPEYRTWVRARVTNFFGLLTAVSLVLALFALVTPWALLALVPAAAFGWIFFILALARYRFSEAGGGYQRRIHELLIERAAGDRVLDIGCGNGHLAIKLARAAPGRHVTGLDYWGAAWEYSRQACERNAALEGVEGRATFVQGSAAALPFTDGEFDGVVSCLTFHEVRDLEDKTGSLTEALRVLRPGGTFVFLDLFSDTSHYPDQGLPLARIEQAGGVQVEMHPLSSPLRLPFPLNHKKVLKHGVVISGKKSGPGLSPVS